MGATKSGNSSNQNKVQKCNKVVATKLNVIKFNFDCPKDCKIFPNACQKIVQFIKKLSQNRASGKMFCLTFFLPKLLEQNIFPSNIDSHVYISNEISIEFVMHWKNSP